MILQRLNNRKGFNILELMIVFAIIGILAAIAIPQFNRLREKQNAKNNIIIEEKVIVEKPSLTPKVKEPTKQKESMKRL
jgi:prepilin-type N-terminal cleavage/methylation domain-containing protein